MIRALVTGGAGFIGSNLANTLHDMGWHVEIVDDMSNGHVQFLHVDLKSSRLCVDDFTCPDILNNIKNQSYDYVFHLAANPRVAYSLEKPAETHEVNVLKTLHLMNACRGNIKRFVFAASSSAYGDAKFLPTSEECPDDPRSPYALQKAIIEKYLKLYSSVYGLDSVCLRFFNVFGPNQLGDSPYSTAISAWLTAIKQGKSMRSDGDGSQSRDMCYIDNVVDCLVKSALFEGKLNAEILNVGVGKVVTNGEMLDYLKARYPDAISHNVQWRAGDVMHTKADITKAKNLLGYEPKVNVWQGLDATIDWYDNNWVWLKDL